MDKKALRHFFKLSSFVFIPVWNNMMIEFSFLSELYLLEQFCNTLPVFLPLQFADGNL